MNQSKGSVKSINISKKYLGLWSKNSMKSSPHFSSSRRSKVQHTIDSSKRIHGRVLSMIKNQESMVEENRKPQHRPSASVVHESFTSMKREPKLTIPKTCSNKENDGRSDNIGIVLNVEENNNKGVIFTANDSYINNLTINPVAYTNKPVEGSKDLSSTKSEKRFKRENLKKCDSEWFKIASRLEIRLKKSVRKSDRSSAQERFNVYRSFFSEIINVDSYFGGMLKKIQAAYESMLSELKDSLAKQNDYYESKLHQVINEESNKRKLLEQQNLSILKELKRQAMYIENLKGHVKELKMQRTTELKDYLEENNSLQEHEASKNGTRKKTEEHRREYPANELITLKKSKVPKPKEAVRTEITPSKKKMEIPKLDLSKLHKANHKKPNQKETADEPILDYNDEFMAMEDEFSKSWKEALENEKRY